MAWIGLPCRCSKIIWHKGDNTNYNAEAERWLYYRLTQHVRDCLKWTDIPEEITWTVLFNHGSKPKIYDDVSEIRGEPQAWWFPPDEDADEPLLPGAARGPHAALPYPVAALPGPPPGIPAPVVPPRRSRSRSRSPRTLLRQASHDCDEAFFFFRSMKRNLDEALNKL